MEFLRIMFMLIFMFVLVSINMSCSGSVERANLPTEPGLNSLNIPDSVAVVNSNRSILAVYDAVIDPVAKTITINPSSCRIAGYHFPLTQLYPNVLQITGYGWTPNFWADIKIQHPFPGSGIDAFDPRVIAILPARSGVAFYYPVFNAIGNNKVVLEPDGYTKLFDNLGGTIPGNTNPFKAYFKDQPYRIWSSTGVTSETQRWNLNLSGFGGGMNFKLVVDVSTNYPSTPQSEVDNAPEPVQMDVSIVDNLTVSGGSAGIEVTLLDWQGSSGIKCQIEAPDLFTGVVQLNYSGVGPISNTYVYNASFSNQKHAGTGVYGVLIAAWDIATDVHIYSEAKVVVNDDPFQPHDVTPEWLNFSPRNIFIDGNYAYIAGDVNGMHIFNITNPENPVWVKKIDTNGICADVYVTGGYAYIADETNGLVIVDIDPLQSASIVKIYPTLSVPSAVQVVGELAYIADGDSGLTILDVVPPDQTHFEKVVTLGDTTFDLEVVGYYAYVTTRDFLKVIDIHIAQPVVKGSVATGFSGHALDVSGNYAYIVSQVDCGFASFDVTNESSPHKEDTISTDGCANGVFVSGNYAYVADGDKGMSVVDITDPTSLHLDGNVDTKGNSRSIWVSGNYAFLANNTNGLQVINKTNPLSPYYVTSIETPGYAVDVQVANGYAFVANYLGLQIIDVDNPVNSTVLKTITTQNYLTTDVWVENGYAYAGGGLELYVIDIDPIETADIVKVVSIRGTVMSIYTGNNIAYVGTYGEGIQFVDISIPEDAHVEANYPTYSIRDLWVEGDYAYVAIWQYGLEILKINPGFQVDLVNSVDTPGYTTGVYVKNGYAFVTDHNGLNIVDVDPVDSAYIAKTVATPSGACNVFVFGDYAFISDEESGLQILDVSPIDQSSIFASMDTPGNAEGIFVDYGYAYIADNTGGLRIISLNK